MRIDKTNQMVFKLKKIGCILLEKILKNEKGNKFCGTLLLQNVITFIILYYIVNSKITPRGVNDECKEPIILEFGRTAWAVCVYFVRACILFC